MRVGSVLPHEDYWSRKLEFVSFLQWHRSKFFEGHKFVKNYKQITRNETDISVCCTMGAVFAVQVPITYIKNFLVDLEDPKFPDSITYKL